MNFSNPQNQPGMTMKYFTSNHSAVAAPPGLLPESSVAESTYRVARNYDEALIRSEPKMFEPVIPVMAELREGAESPADTNAAQKIRQSILYMRQHLDQPLQVAVLAAHVNVSQSHFFAIFKRLTGSTPIDYFIHLRVQQACHLLRTTSSSIKEVAGTLGYDDPFYFSRVFRSVQGIAPSEYRQASREVELRVRCGNTSNGRLAVVPVGGSLTSSNER